MKLILHAGTHKTGTTTTQRVLFENRHWLRQRGLFYPTFFEPLTGGAHHRVAHALASSEPSNHQKVAEFLARVRRETNPDETVLLSAEAIYRHVAGGLDWAGLVAADYWDYRQEYLDTVGRALSDFDVEVVLLFRDYGYFLAWLHRKLARQRVWNGDVHEFKRLFAERFEYERQLERFRRVFPVVRTYSYEDALPVGLMPYFFEAIGYPMPPGAEEVWERKTKIPVVPFSLQDEHIVGLSDVHSGVRLNSELPSRNRTK